MMRVNLKHAGLLLVMGALLFSERLSATQLAWLGIAFAGVVLIVQAKPGASYTGSGYIAGVLLALGAAFFYAVAAMITKKLSGTPPHMIALAQVCVGIVMIAPFANLSDLPTDARAWGSFAVMGVVYTGLVFVLLYGAIQKLPTHAVAPCPSSTPSSRSAWTWWPSTIGCSRCSWPARRRSWWRRRA